MITEILTILHGGDFFGSGKHIEIAKGKNEYISSMRIAGRKINRAWRSKKK